MNGFARSIRWVTAALAVTGLGTSPLNAQAPPAEVAPAPAEPTAAPAPECQACVEDDIRKKLPLVRTPARPGFFPILPTGRGYYSLADVLNGECREGPPKYGYPRFALMPPSFFDIDFRYLDDPKNTDHDFFDPLKRVRIGDDWLFSTGGSAWNRYMNEYNSRLGTTNNTYHLSRARIYGDLWFRDDVRLFAEFMGAYSNGHDLPPLAIDRDRADFQNLFLDIKTINILEKPVYVRVGRQELSFGSQRLVSPPDWANVRRTFQGVRAFRTSEKFDVDAFWTRPVIPNPGELNSWDDNQSFYGLWMTYRPKKGQVVDAYYLGLDNTNRITQQGIVRSPFDVHTFGSRYVGDKDGALLWDFEGAIQFGDRGDARVFAGMATAGLGYHFKDAPLNPTFWAYYDYASGDESPNAGTVGTFNHLFPFGHQYMGWADLVGRQNIQDFNMHLYLYPTNWVTVWFQYHRFWLDSARDALYGVAGQAYRRDPTGAAGRDVGHEFDVAVNFHLTKHADVITGYSHLFGGEFLRRTAGPGRGVDSSLYYLMVNYRW